MIGILFLIGCSVQSRENPGDSSQGLDLPEEIQAIENLTVYPADQPASRKIEFHRETTFGETDEVMIGRAGRIAIDDSGRLYMADHGRLMVHVFQPDGSYLTSIGRDGDGPGEFRSVQGFLFHKEHLYVYDSAPRRFSTFALDSFEYRETIQIFPDSDGRIEHPGGAMPIQPLSIREDGTFLVYYIQIRGRYFEPEDPDVDAYHRFYLLSQDGRRFLDRIFQQRYSILFPMRPD
ncbi:MAG: 6-bladed beta-propeller, partial [Balneolaceae bacterium]